MNVRRVESISAQLEEASSTGGIDQECGWSCQLLSYPPHGGSLIENVEQRAAVLLKELAASLNLRHHCYVAVLRLLRPWDFPGKDTGVGCHFLLQGNLPDPGIKTMFPVSPALQAGSLSTEPSGKPTADTGHHKK